MGKVGKNALLAGIRGKVGPLSVARIKGQDIVKILPDKTTKTVSPAAAAQRSKLQVFNLFFGNLPQSFIASGFRPRDGDTHSPWDLCKSWHLKYAITGVYPHFRIDLSKVKFSSSSRPIENGWNASMTAMETQGIGISWEMNPYPEKSTQPDDEAVIVWYCPEKGSWRHQAQIPRSNCSFTIPVREANRADHLVCWIFFLSKDNKLVSETLYLGEVNMKKDPFP